MCLILNSCSQDTLSDNTSPDIGTDEAPYLAINLNADDIVSSEENQIQKIRAIVVNGTGQPVTNILLTPDAPINNIFQITAKANFGDCSLYIICNETKELGDKLNVIKFDSEIENAQYSANNLTTPLTMYAKISGINILYNKSTKKVEVRQGGTLVSTINAAVKRTMAKLSFVAIKKIEGGEKFSVESLSFQICQTPRYSLLPENHIFDPLKEEWAENVIVKGEGSLSLDKDGEYIESGDGYTVGQGVDMITAPSVYIPEHLLSSEEDNISCTYLLVEAKCKPEGSSTIVNAKYRINLGKNPPINNNLPRNTHYRVYATIKDMGATGIYAEIVPLKEYNTPIVWKTIDGYAIMGECETEHNNDIWNNFSQYSGILKIKKSDGKYSDALFRYGSVIALEPTTTSSSFQPNTVLWQPFPTPAISVWSDLTYLDKETDINKVHTLDNIKNGKGDPCRLVGLTNDDIRNGTIDNKTWRMPTSEEMKWLLVAKNSTNKSKGFYSYNYLVTPNTGFRSENGTMAPVAQKGYYWSSIKANAFIFNSADNTGSVAVDDPQKAYAIRCIRTSIPHSRLSVGDATIDYNGKKNIPLELADLFLTPYWKMEAVSPTTGITFSKSEGTYDEQALVNIAPSGTYTPNSFKIKVTGYGLDGTVNVIYTQIRQLALSHSITLELASPSGLITSGGYLRVPKAGGKLGFKINVSPELQPPYDASNIGNWQVHVSYYDTANRNITGTPAPIGNISYIDMPENNHGTPVALYLEMKPVDKAVFPPYSSGNLIFVHEK